MIFPEGTTSNNTHILKFHRGAFSSLRPVIPITLEYDCPHVNCANTLKGDPMTAILMACCFRPTYVTVKRYPVFIPNDTMFDKSSNTNKVDVYSSAVRSMMCRETGLPEHNQSWQELNQYWKFLSSIANDYNLQPKIVMPGDSQY